MTPADDLSRSARKPADPEPPRIRAMTQPAETQDDAPQRTEPGLTETGPTEPAGQDLTGPDLAVSATAAARGLLRGTFPALARSLAEQRQHVLRDWERLVRLRFPHTRSMSREEVLDDLPALLDDLIQTFAEPGHWPVTRLLREAPLHGYVRVRQQYSAIQMVDEFQLLRRVLRARLRRHLARPFARRELNAFEVAMDLCLRHSVAAFARQREAEAKRDNESARMWLNFVSHDLRNELNSAVLGLQAVAADLSEGHEALAEEVGHLGQNILKTAEMLNHLLQAERTRQEELRLVPTPVGPAVRAVVAKHEQAAGREVHVTEPSNATALADRGLLERVLDNLIGNAVRYARVGPVHVRIYDKEDRVIIDVVDDGVGFSKDVAKGLFQPFSRGKETDDKGFGLGLYIAKTLVDLMGGDIVADSEPGTGTTFSVRLAKP
ncbi:MAG: sensor histidine kinase [Phycisphaerae bacterium]